METNLFLVQSCEELVQKVYKDLLDKYGDLPYEQTIILVLFRKITEKADAINVLIENECGRVTDSLARELLESYWHLCYLLESDTNFRTLSYYYFSKIDKAESLIRHIEYQVSMNPKFELMTANTKRECQEMINYLTNDDLFKEIREEIAKKNQKYPKWYSLNNDINSLKKLAEHLGLLGEYEASYGLFSGEVHGLTGTSHISIENNNVLIAPLRSVAEGEGRQAFCQYYLSLSIEKFVQYFRLDDHYSKLRTEMAERIREDRYRQMSESIKAMRERLNK